MRRKAGQLVPLEVAICEVAAALRARGTEAFHGYELAKALAHAADVQQLTAYGTLYRALGGLEKSGLLTSAWEDPAIPARENRPGRRLHSLTQSGIDAAVESQRVDEATGRSRVPRVVPA